MDIVVAPPYGNAAFVEQSSLGPKDWIIGEPLRLATTAPEARLVAYDQVRPLFRSGADDFWRCVDGRNDTRALLIDIPLQHLIARCDGIYRVSLRVCAPAECLYRINELTNLHLMLLISVQSVSGLIRLHLHLLKQLHSRLAF